MKSHTDLNQSKKLAEILPIESADMMWEDWGLIDEGWVLGIGYYPEVEKDYGRKCYPAWSLAALIETMPEILIERVKAQDGYDGYYYFVAYKELIEVPYKKELIDATVEMILKLHEQKLI